MGMEQEESQIGGFGIQVLYDTRSQVWGYKVPRMLNLSTTELS